METSKIIVFGVPFMKALKAALAVAPRKEPRDLVQFRIVGEELFISARTMWEVITVEVPTRYVDANYERDEWFEITRAEAQTLSAMRIKATDDEDDPQIGLTIHEDYILRTDETGLGLGLRSVKVKRNQPIWESQLGNIPQHMQKAREQEPMLTWPILSPEQWSLVGRVSAAMQEQLTIWSPTPEHHGVVQNVLTSEAVTMSIMCSKMNAEIPDNPDGDSESKADYVDVPLFGMDEETAKASEESTAVDAEVQETEPVDKSEEPEDEAQPSSPGLYIVKASPPGGLA